MAEKFSSPAVPTSQHYAAALRGVRTSDKHIRMLRAHYHAPRRTVTAAQLARALGYTQYRPVNTLYGRLSSSIGEELNFRPAGVKLNVLTTLEYVQDEWHWIMRPEVARALERLCWVGTLPLLPEEIEDAAEFREGAVRRVYVNAYERNAEARRRCIDYYGARCYICRFDFGRVYGTVAEGFIHVHHLRALSEVGEEYQVDYKKDLRPVCPNCHAVAHLRVPPFSIEEVGAFLERPEPLGVG